MTELRNILTEVVKESAIADIILNSKYNLERLDLIKSNKCKNLIIELNNVDRSQITYQVSGTCLIVNNFTSLVKVVYSKRVVMKWENCIPPATGINWLAMRDANIFTILYSSVF